jgi:hypothetical protein
MSLRSVHTIVNAARKSACATMYMHLWGNMRENDGTEFHAAVPDRTVHFFLCDFRHRSRDAGVVCARDATHVLGPQYNVMQHARGGTDVGGLLFLRTLVLIVPKYAASLGSMSMRTVVFEPPAIACLAWLLQGRAAIPTYLLALSLIVFGVDHLIALEPIGSLMPPWIPWLKRPAAIGIGLMFAIWRVLGWYGIPGAPREVALWGGSWALCSPTFD